MFIVVILFNARKNLIEALRPSVYDRHYEFMDDAP